MVLYLSVGQWQHLNVLKASRGLSIPGRVTGTRVPAQAPPLIQLCSCPPGMAAPVSTMRTVLDSVKLCGCALPQGGPSRLKGGRTRLRWVQMLPARLASQAQPAGRATHPPHRMPHLKPSPAQVQTATKLSFTSFEVAFPLPKDVRARCAGSYHLATR